MQLTATLALFGFYILAGFASCSPLNKRISERLPTILDNGCDFGDRLGGYKLYTRKTINEGECILPNSDSLRRSSFDEKKNITFFAHGYLGAGWNWYMHEMKNAMLAKEDINFVIVDWSKASVDWLPDAYDNAEKVAEEIVPFLTLLISESHFKMSPMSIHLIGHSMGGRVMGLTGQKMKTKVGRITGLDPMPGTYKGLAHFTDVIHTTFLADEAVADADFWPNNLDIGGTIPWVSPHMYAVYMYTESINRCAFVAYECPSWENFEDGACTNNPTGKMGYYAPKEAGRGKMYLSIKKEPPFC